VHPLKFNCIVDEGKCNLEIKAISSETDSALYNIHGYVGAYLHHSGSSLLSVASGTSSYYAIAAESESFPLWVSFNPIHSIPNTAPELAISIFVEDPRNSVIDGPTTSTSSKEFVIREGISPVQETRTYLVFQLASSSTSAKEGGFVRFKIRSINKSSPRIKPMYGSIGAVVFVVGFLLLITLLIIILRKRGDDFLAPLDHRSWNQMPIIRYSPSSSDIPKDDAFCSICLQPYEEPELVRKLSCAHHFHKDCVETWILMKPICPLCQQHVNNGKDFRAPGAAQLYDVNLEA